MNHSDESSLQETVIPAQAGIQAGIQAASAARRAVGLSINERELDSRLRGNDGSGTQAAVPADWPAPEKLAFGQFLAPLVVMAGHSPVEGWSALRIVPLADAHTPVASGGMQYGLSVFEGLKAYRDAHGAAQLFRPREHAARLQSSADRLGMPALDVDGFVEACRLAVRIHDAFLPPHGRGSLYLRPTIYAVEEALGFRVATRHSLALIVMPCCDPPDKILNLWAEPELTRAAAGGLGAAKTGGNYAAGLLGLLRAKEQGCDDVAWLDAATHLKLAEAGTMNLFVEIDGVWCTPPLDGTILAGITRDSLMVLMRGDGMRVEERELALDELASLSRAGRTGDAFGTGTAARLVRIASIRGPRHSCEFRDAGETARLAAMLKQVQEGTDAAHAEWCVPV